MVPSPYVFLLGRTPGLSSIELNMLFPSVPFEQVTEDIVVASVPDLSPAELIERLGGTVKIAQNIAVYPGGDREAVVSYILQHAGSFPLTFALTARPPLHIPVSFLTEVKESLTAHGHVRFVRSKEGHELSALHVRYEGVQEFLLFPYRDEIAIAHVVAGQDIDAWGKRDFGRPWADPKTGMLPPKVARMVVNIGLGLKPQGKNLLDPYCGMGTILAEGYMVGASVTGSDISEEICRKAEENLRWLSEEFPIKDAVSPRVFASDAVHIGSLIEPESVDAIITEPFMGNPAIARKSLPEQEREIHNIIKGLEKLYIGSLKEWKNILKQQALVVMAIPSFRIGARGITVKKVIDTCENLGYSIDAGPFQYSRPQAVVERQFYIFRKQ